MRDYSPISRNGGALISLSDKCSIVSFNGEAFPVFIKKLSDSECKSCGEFGLIETLADQARMARRLSDREKAAGAEVRNNIVQKTIGKELYEEIRQRCIAEKGLENVRAEIKEVDSQIQDTKPGPKLSRLKKQRDALDLQICSVLPIDFVADIIDIALNISDSGIKDIDEDMLLTAGILAERGHNNPSDHIDGAWNNLPNAQFYRDNINVRAWGELDQLRKENAKK